MDSLKQLVASRLKAQASGQAHPDADALSAFAENALAPAARQSILEHVGVCADCRAILFLAAPLPADAQPIVAVKKSWAPFALRWGAVAASLVIVAAVVGRHELTRTPPVARVSPEMQKALPPSAPVAPSNSPAKESYIAAEKAPAELDARRDRLSANVPQVALPDHGHAEAKAITAQPQATLDFKKSGQVSVEPQSADSNLEAKAGANSNSNSKDKDKDLPVSSRSAGELITLTPRSAPAARAVGAAAGSPISVASSSSVNGLAGQNPYHGSVSGTIADATGAVVPNAKVSAIGPLGERTAFSDQAGKFFFDGLAAGEYSFKVAAPGFRQQLQQVAVLPNKPATTVFELEVAPTTGTVEVAAGALEVPMESAKSPALAASETGAATGTGTGAAGKVAPAAQQMAQLQASDKVVNAPELNKQKSSDLPSASRDANRNEAAPAPQWSLSSEGTVQRSGDHGATWQLVAVGNGTAFRAIFAAGPNVWAGGNAGALFHSADLGQHWIQIVPAANGEKLLADVTRIDFSDARHGTVTAANGQKWTTSDGGQTWARK